jgi:acyl dehydratase
MVLRSWQQELVARSPELFLRGLIHSDGCRFTNPVRHGEKLYTYPRYNFTNASADIRKLFCDTCDLLAIEWRVMNARNVSVARRESVARLDEFIGPKR